ncbi:MAG: Gfo/Idh/MocA family oxidoreductase [Planctomycetes bacterium]|nr:Gfo/Idh/MocA family oxidoreductase [Planctomycetota bacterium]
MIRIGIIGLGYWGPNLVRVLTGLRDCRPVAFCDLNIPRLKSYSERYPEALATTDVSEVLTRDCVDAVIIATPTKTHFALARRALEQGLHVFVEKPLATTSAECEELIALAEQNEVTLFVGHVFLYSAPVAKLKDMVETGELGDLYYISSCRRNLGPVRHDVSALWDLAPHDISIMLELMGSLPRSVSCSGLAYLNRSIHDVCTLTMHFENNRMGVVHVSWLDPHKKREMTVVGSKKMAVYNDVEPLEKIKVYDNGVTGPMFCESFGEFQFSYRYGDTYSPRLVEVEPLKAECRAFLDSIATGTASRTDGQNGLNVVRVLEAADMSLHSGHGEVHLDAVEEQLASRHTLVAKGA